jgi:hypothetical protein
LRKIAGALRFLCARPTTFAGSDVDVGTIPSIVSAIVELLACGTSWSSFIFARCQAVFLLKSDLHFARHSVAPYRSSNRGQAQVPERNCRDVATGGKRRWDQRPLAKALVADPPRGPRFAQFTGAATVRRHECRSLEPSQMQVRHKVLDVKSAMARVFLLLSPSTFVPLTDPTGGVSFRESRCGFLPLPHGPHLLSAAS